MQSRRLPFPRREEIGCTRGHITGHSRQILGLTIPCGECPTIKSVLEFLRPHEAGQRTHDPAQVQLAVRPFSPYWPARGLAHQVPEAKRL
jgi:hypothetical protein